MASRTQTNAEPTSGSAMELVHEGNIAGFRDELIYETISLQDCHYSKSLNVFYYLCPCGDLFEFPLAQLQEGNLVSECPSCSLRVRLDLKEGELDPYIQIK